MTDAELIARLRQVRRYRLVNEPGYQGQMLVRSDGKYVLHTDYVALLEQLAAARQDAKEAEAYAEELEAKLAKAVEALTPSGDTKAEYMGEFHFSQTMIGEDGDEVTVKTYVPWTTIKKIMAAINARATLAEIKGESHD